MGHGIDPNLGMLGRYGNQIEIIEFSYHATNNVYDKLIHSLDEHQIQYSINRNNIIFAGADVVINGLSIKIKFIRRLCLNINLF